MDTPLGSTGYTPVHVGGLPDSSTTTPTHVGDQELKAKIEQVLMELQSLNREVKELTKVVDGLRLNALHHNV